MRYFFISFAVCGGGIGNAVLQQHPQTDGLPDNGMNIATATGHFMDRFKAPVVIISWHEITQVRYEQWNKFLDTKKGPEQLAPILSLVKSDLNTT